MKYVAVILDIIDSRHYEDRYYVQSFLMESIAYLNFKYSYAIKKDVVSSAGDEFQGLFKDLQTAFLYVRKLQLLVYPIKIRCGIGYGEIKYDRKKWTSVSIDGDAYYLARDAINSIQKRKINTICFNTNSRYDKYLNALCMSGNEVKLKQSYMVQFIELIADMILPIEPIDESESFYNYILRKRKRLIEQEKLNIVTRKFIEIEEININLEYLFDIKQSIDAKYYCEDSFCIDEFWMHGMSTYIAQIMDTSRQNIDRYVRLGRVKESRTMDRTIYEMLGEKIW